MMLGLPDATKGCVFDLDGVLTDTARIHAQAWKETFDTFLSRRLQPAEPFVPFDAKVDYETYVDGKPRYDGVRDFLRSRRIDLRQGAPSDPPGAETICGVGNAKNDLVLRLIRERGVQPYPGSLRYLRAARQNGLVCAVASSSTNCRDVLAAAGIDHLFQAVIDGVVAEEQHLRGKPAPDVFLAATKALGVDPAHSALFEDALAGVAAGRAGKFACVIGIDRSNHADALRQSGADIVVSDLAELMPPA